MVSPLDFPLFPAVLSFPSPSLFDPFNKFDNASEVDFEGFGVGFTTGLSSSFFSILVSGFLISAIAGASSFSETTNSFSSAGVSTTSSGAAVTTSFESKLSPDPKSLSPKFTAISPPPPPPSISGSGKLSLNFKKKNNKKSNAKLDEVMIIDFFSCSVSNSFIDSKIEI